MTHRSPAPARPRAARRCGLLLWLAACGSSAPAPTQPAEPAPPAEATAAAPQPAPAVAPAVAPQPAPSPEPAPAAAAPDAPPAPPQYQLTDTAADRLGTAPDGLGLAVGARAPDARLVDILGKPVRLSQLYPHGPTFVVFYRGGWCPFCNLQLHALAQARAEFDKQGLRVVAISVDVPREEAKTHAAQGVPFAMLSDSRLVAHKAFKVVHVPSADEAQALARFGVDLEKYSEQDHRSFAVPSIFLIDRKGVVRWRHVDEEYKTRPSPAQLLEIAAKVLAK